MKNRILTLALIALLPFTASADCVSTLIGSGINPLASQNICTIQGTFTVSGPLAVDGSLTIGDDNAYEVVANNIIMRNAHLLYGTDAGGTETYLFGQNTSDETVINAKSGNAVETRVNNVVVTSTDSGGLNITGELSITGAPTVSGVLCRKADGDIGQCTSVVAAGGTCTCG